MKATEEQLEASHATGNRKIEAVAGSGKTTTAKMICENNPNKSVLYLCFNRSNKNEIAGNFPRNAQVETAHSLAYKKMRVYQQYELRPSNYSEYEVVSILKIPKKKGEDYYNVKVASHVLKKLEAYCNSAAQKLSDIDITKFPYGPKALEFVKEWQSEIDDYTVELWNKMVQKEIEITHSFYLKLFQLTCPDLDKDIIIFDEAQDASPQMLDIVFNQNSEQVFLGDSNQQIYSWRGAVDSLAQVNYKSFPLSNSFRFRQDVADLAKKILSLKDIIKAPYTASLTGLGSCETLKTKCVITRNNSTLLEEALAQLNKGVQKIFFEGGYSSYIFESNGSIYDVLNLYLGNTKYIRSKFIQGFERYSDAREYAETVEDAGLLVYLGLVDRYGGDLFNLLKRVKESSVATKSDAEMIFSTTHKAKGQEYDYVHLGSDFVSELQIRDALDTSGKLSDWERGVINENINILYVAATRAKNKLFFPSFLFEDKNNLLSTSRGLPF